MYYHLSAYDNIHRLIPHVPNKTWLGYEDDYTKRICFSDSINGCLRALYAGDGEVYSVYIPNANIQVYAPSEQEVVDCKVSGEVWSVKETGVINIGIIQVVRGIVVGEVEKQDLCIPLINFIYSHNIIKGG